MRFTGVKYYLYWFCSDTYVLAMLFQISFTRFAIPNFNALSECVQINDGKYLIDACAISKLAVFRNWLYLRLWISELFMHLCFG